jgi:hypothetical protein
VVLDTDAVVDPGAVMIKPLNTLIASTAMPGSWSTDDEAIGAELDWIDHLHKLEEINIFRFFYESWIRKLCS